MKPIAHIENWILYSTSEGAKWLTGEISNHPNQDNFRIERQHTSQIVSEDWENNRVETENTIYTLGKKFAPIPNRVFL